MGQVIVNVYFPPTSKSLKHESRIKMIDEFIACVDFIRGKYAGKSIVIVGDFNLPSINWIEENNSEILRPLFVSTPNRTKQYFFNKLGDVAIFQQNMVVNENQKILDLVFTGEHRSLMVQKVEQNEFLDKSSPHHFPLHLELILDTQISDEISTFCIKVIRLKKSKSDLIKWVENCNFYSESLELLSFDVDNGFAKLSEVIKVHTKTVSTKSFMSFPKHPWLRCAEYKSLYTKKRKLLKKLNQSNLLSDRQELQLVT